MTGDLHNFLLFWPSASTEWGKDEDQEFHELFLLYSFTNTHFETILQTVIQNVKNYEDRQSYPTWIFWCRTWIEIKWSSRGKTWWKSLCPRRAADRMECYQGDSRWASADSLPQIRTHAHGVAVIVLRSTFVLKTALISDYLCYWTFTISLMLKNWTRLWSYVEFYKDKSGMLNTMRIIKRRTGRRSARYRRFKWRLCRQEPKV